MMKLLLEYPGDTGSGSTFSLIIMCLPSEVIQIGMWEVELEGCPRLDYTCPPAGCYDPGPGA